MRMAPVTRADAGTLLARALVADAARHDLHAAVVDWRSHPWASATFVGARHLGALRVSGDATGWVAGLADVDFGLRGHLVADVVARADPGGYVAIEALTLDAA